MRLAMIPSNVHYSRIPGILPDTGTRRRPGWLPADLGRQLRSSELCHTPYGVTPLPKNAWNVRPG